MELQGTENLGQLKKHEEKKHANKIQTIRYNSIVHIIQNLYN